jgi:hypothetical protein
MTVVARYGGDIYADGNVGCKTLTVSTASITNAMVVASAAISASKLESPVRKKHAYDIATEASAQTVVLHTARGAGTIVAFEVGCLVAPDTEKGSSGKYATIDLQKSTGAGAFASILTATIEINSTNAVRTMQAGSLSTATIVDGDILALVITAAGSAGNNAKGIFCELQLGETYAA